jgi:hypothetical protein
MFSEDHIKKILTLPNYNKWLKGSFYANTPPSDDWDPKTATCGAHASFVIDALGFKTKDYRKDTLLTPSTIDKIIEQLNKGYLVDFIHNYKDSMEFSKLPKDNRYGNHQFQIVKGGNKYFITQGFLHAYKHSLIAYTEEEIRTILENIITELSDYEDNKKWSDLNLDLYEKYFRTPLFMYPKKPVLKDRLIHNVVLTYDVYKNII